MRLTEEQYQALLRNRGRAPSISPPPAQARQKYGNKKTEVAGKVLDSKGEARRYQDLLLLEKSGAITDLKRQVRFRIEVNGHHICDYVADFVYVEGGARVVEDYKSDETRKIERYRLKKKLMRAVHGIEIREVVG